MNEQIPPKPEKVLDSGLTWQYDTEIGDWVIASTPVMPKPIEQANEYFFLSLEHLHKAPCLTIKQMSRATHKKVKHLFLLSNLSQEPILEQWLDDDTVRLGLPLYEDDMMTLIENHQ